MGTDPSPNDEENTVETRTVPAAGQIAVQETGDFKETQIANAGEAAWLREHQADPFVTHVPRLPDVPHVPVRGPQPGPVRE